MAGTGLADVAGLFGISLTVWQYPRSLTGDVQFIANRCVAAICVDSADGLTDIECAFLAFVWKRNAAEQHNHANILAAKCRPVWKGCAGRQQVAPVDVCV